MARLATEKERSFEQPEEDFDSGTKIISPKSVKIEIQGEEIVLKKWNLGQLTELGEEIANIILAISDSKDDPNMVMAIVSSKLPIVLQVVEMTTGKSKEWCNLIDGDELMDIYEACKNLNESFFRRLSKVLPTGMGSLPTDQGKEDAPPETSQKEYQDREMTGSISSEDLLEMDTDILQPNLETENILE